MKPLHLRRNLMLRLAYKYNLHDKMFHISANKIPMTATDVNKIMGLPIQGYDINVRTNAPVNMGLFNLYKTNNKILLSGLEERITASSVPDDDFLRQVVLFAIGTILAPTTKKYVHSKYLAIVENVAELPNLNWGHFTLNNLLSSIHSFRVKEHVCLQGNLPLLQYWYWEHIQAYSHWGVNYSPIPPPLTARWDENNANLRDKAYAKDKIEGGVVIMNITTMTGLHNSTDAPPTMEGHGVNHTQENVSHQEELSEIGALTISITMTQMNLLFRCIMKTGVDIEKKVDRKLMIIEHKLDSRVLALQEEIAQVRMEGADQTRLSKLEDDIAALKREFQGRCGAGDGIFTHKQQDKSSLRPLAGTPTTKVISQQRTSGDDVPKQHVAPSIPIFHKDYRLRDKDLEVKRFLLTSYEDAEVVQIDEYALTVEMLKRNVNKGFIYDEVINAYIYISCVETDSTSCLTAYLTTKLIGHTWGIPQKGQMPWAGRIAKKCIGQHMVFIPMNILDCHWILVVINFKKREIQVLNSKPSLRDEPMETTLVQSLQACIEYSVAAGFVTIDESFDITTWEKCCYTNIPTQANGYSCGSYVLKYMLTLLYSNCNKCQKESYEKPLTVCKLVHILIASVYIEEYLVMYPQDKQADPCNHANDDGVKVIPNPDGDRNTKNPSITKRKRGRPKKLKNVTTTVLEQFSSNRIAQRVKTKRSRVVKPGPHQSSPYKAI
ncbi:hypothetical protein BS78_05G166700 [Paspalum vaginatum]|nr:hypothetical protein BS78_05G166700 [Paspalum vaginatum]